jgi:hypothetical protein
MGTAKNSIFDFKWLWNQPAFSAAPDTVRGPIAIMPDGYGHIEANDLPARRSSLTGKAAAGAIF